MPTNQAHLYVAYNQDEALGASPIMVELMQYIFALPDDARTRLLAFLHLTEDLGQVASELQVAETGEVHLKLSSRP